MEEKEVTRIDDDELPCQSEDRIDIRRRLAPLAESGEESLRLFHELQVHQIELEMQNEELCQARNKLEEAREKYTDLYDFAPVGYFTLNRAGIISSVNLMGSTLLKIERSQLIGQRFANFLPVEARPSFAEFLTTVFTGLVKEAFETALENTLFFQIEALAAASGQECRITLTDITERKRTEVELLSKNLILTTQMETAINGILVVDENDKIKLFNQRFIEMWGIPPELFDTKEDAPVLQFVVAQVVDAESFQERIRYLYAHREEKSRNEITLKDGRIFERYSAPMFDDKGKYFGREWYFHDITELKSNERVNLACMHMLKSAATYSLDELLQATLDEAEKLTGSLIGFYHFLAADQKTLSLQSWSSRTKAGFCASESQGLHYDVSEAGVWVDCIRQRCPVIHNDYAVLPHRKGLPPGHAPLIRELVVPVFRNDSIVAILGMGNKARDYTQQDVEAVSLLADLTWEIVERKIAEESLQKSEERYRSLVTATSQIVWTTNAAGEVVDDLPSMRAFNGQSTEEIKGYGWSNAIHPDDIQQTLAAWKEAVETHSFYNTVFRMLRHDGEYRYLNSRGVPVIGKDGKIREWIGTCTDITEFKESSRRIKDSEMRYRRLFESAKDGILILEAESGLIFDVNPYLCELLGFSSEDFIGKHLWEIGAFKDIAASKDAFRTLQEKEYICYDDLPLSTKDGRKVEVEFVSNVYMVDKLKVIQCNIRDITENRKLEEQLRQSQKMEAVGQLAGGIAHDFNNILSAIVGFSTLVQMDMAENDPSHAHMEQVLAAVDRGAELTKSLLAFSRKQVMQPAPANLNEIILKTGKFLGRIIGEDIAFETTFKKETLTVNVDSGQIEQVLMNLATNARDAMPNGGTFSIATESVEIDHNFLDAHNYGVTGRYAQISVTDTGTGMDAATTARIFEPFFSTKDVGKGTGLGLPIVYGIIKQHNGFINVYSEPGIGTTFRIYLPLLLENSLDERAQAPSLPIPRGAETILLAEDDTMIRTLTKGFLTDFGYTVITATDGEDAISKFKENKERIQLLLFDLIMPKKSGKAAYDEIKKSGSDVRAIFVSGYLLDVIYKKGLEDERCDLVMKPVSPQDLLRKIREVLDR